VCEDDSCRAAKLHSGLALRVGLRDGVPLKASMLAATFSFFRPLAAVLTAQSEGVIVFGKEEDLQNALAFQSLRIVPFASPLPPATPLPAAARAAASPDTRDDSAATPVVSLASAATPPVARAAEAPAVEAAADVPRAQKSAKSREWAKDGFEYEQSNTNSVRSDGSCRWPRKCSEKGCRAVRVIEFDANWLAEIDRTSPPHNHAPVRLNEALASNGELWVTTRHVVRDDLTINSLRCSTPNCFARRRIKRNVGDGTLVSDETWGVHVHSPEERDAVANKDAVEETIARDRDEDLETLAMLRHSQPVRNRRMAKDGYEWRPLGLPVLGDGREQRFLCTACESVRVVRWNIQLEIEADDTAPAHSHPVPVKGALAEDGNAWEQTKVSATPEFTERVYVCKEKGCAATRTVRWNAAGGSVVADAVEGDHVHGEKKLELAKSARTKARGPVRWAFKRFDSYAWRVVKDIPLPSGRESVLICVSNACPATRTVRWDEKLRIVSDVTTPRHSHLPPDPADAGEDSEARKRIRINWAPMVQDGFSWGKLLMKPLPTGLEAHYGCTECESLRIVRWNLESLDVVGCDESAPHARAEAGARSKEATARRTRVRASSEEESQKSRVAIQEVGRLHLDATEAARGNRRWGAHVHLPVQRLSVDALGGVERGARDCI
jgi:hypothetical protein